MQHPNNNNDPFKYIHQAARLLRITLILILVLLCLAMLAILRFFPFTTKSSLSESTNGVEEDFWEAPKPNDMPQGEDGELINYGKELIMHTSVYLGPKGRVKPVTNGMNCKNCHLEGGTRVFGINYGAVASTYPKWRKRSGTTVDVKERINECLQRSLNGVPLEEGNPELEAMAAYLLWIGKDVPKGQIPKGTGMKKLALLDRPADPVKGKSVFEEQCTQCHGKNGEGLMESHGMEWIYPPLYGENSYNVGAGLYRLAKFASFVKYNMPFGISFDSPLLTDEEAWDVAAYVNSMPHPSKDISGDWSDITLKPIDHPFGPFADDWSEERHKYGPFK